jgi:DNA-binding IclR family transcriptional regulator
MPAHCTSTGKAILSTLSSEELRRLYPEETLPPLTPNSLTTRTDLEEDLARSARRGFATSHEESESGVGSIAVAFPLRQTPMRLAVNVSVPVSRFGQAEIKRISETMKAGVAQAATLLH